MHLALSSVQSVRCLVLALVYLVTDVASTIYLVIGVASTIHLVYGECVHSVLYSMSGVSEGNVWVHQAKFIEYLHFSLTYALSR